MSRAGENIKDARLKSGLSQKQLAKKLGVSEKFINEVELGRRIANENLIKRISNVLGKEINDINMYAEELKQEDVKKEAKPDHKEKNNTKKESKEIKEVWSEAFGSVLKSVPVYRYDLNEIIDTREIPIIDNKVEGYSQDKVLFIKIEDNDMIGFRMAKGDIAFGHFTKKIQPNSIYLIEYKGKRIVRQLKKLDNNNILLISNGNTLNTKTVNIKDVKILVKLDKVEIKL